MTTLSLLKIKEDFFNEKKNYMHASCSLNGYYHSSC